MTIVERPMKILRFVAVTGFVTWILIVIFALNPAHQRNLSKLNRPMNSETSPIELNKDQRLAVIEWADDPRLWKSAEDRRLNLVTFARSILKAGASDGTQTARGMNDGDVKLWVQPKDEKPFLLDWGPLEAMKKKYLAELGRRIWLANPDGKTFEEEIDGQTFVWDTTQPPPKAYEEKK